MRQDTIAECAVNANCSRSGDPLHFLGETVFIKVSSEDTTGVFEVVEEITPPQAGPPLHLHKRQDEWLYVLEGKFLFEINGQRIEAPVGHSIFLPRGVPHTFQNIGNSPSKLLAVVAPGGIERFLPSTCPELPRRNSIAGRPQAHF
jgi:quercetin dioxygenase-like cupin family protein